MYTDAAATNPLPSFDGISWYGFVGTPGAVNKSFSITGMLGEVQMVNNCPAPTTTTSTSTTTTTSAVLPDIIIYTEGGSPVLISGSADSAAACGEISSGLNGRTAYLQKQAPNTSAYPEIGDYIYEDAAGTNPVDSFDGSSWYGFIDGPSAKTFNITGIAGQVELVEFC